MKSPTRREQPPAGLLYSDADQDANFTRNGTPKSSISGAFVRLDPDAERFAAELIEKVGVARAITLAEALVHGLRDVHDSGVSK